MTDWSSILSELHDELSTVECNLRLIHMGKGWEEAHLHTKKAEKCVLRLHHWISENWPLKDTRPINERA